MLEIRPHKNFKKDIQRDKTSGSYSTTDFCTLETIIDTLANVKTLDEKYKDHQLKGVLKNFRECHVKPDWLLVYKIDDQEKALYLARVGTHNQIFKR